MSEPTRRQKIEALLAEEPQDVFLRYSLAMALDKEGDYPRSQALFQELIAGEPPYVPACFMLAQQLVRLEEIAPARDVLRRGIDEARRQANSHAAGEMSEFLASLGQLGE